MTAETLLNELHKVRQNGTGKWIACCPAHDDKTPSLSVKEDSDGTILLYCFAGCSAEEIIGSVGLQMGDLFPDTNQHSFNDSPPIPQQRETRGEADLAHIQIRHLTAEAMVEGGHKLSGSERKQALTDYKYLKGIDKIP